MTYDRNRPRRHEGTKNNGLRIASTLPAEIEALITRVIGCCIEVHKALGPGLLEAVYTRAMCIEFDATGLAYEREKTIELFYRGHRLCQYRLDIVVAGLLVLEIKCIERIQSVHHAQLLGYLRASKLRAGLL